VWGALAESCLARGEFGRKGFPSQFSGGERHQEWAHHFQRRCLGDAGPSIWRPRGKHPPPSALSPVSSDTCSAPIPCEIRHETVHDPHTPILAACAQPPTCIRMQPRSNRLSLPIPRADFYSPTVVILNGPPGFIGNPWEEGQVSSRFQRCRQLVRVSNGQLSTP